MLVAAALAVPLAGLHDREAESTAIGDVNGDKLGGRITGWSMSLGACVVGSSMGTGTTAETAAS